MKKRYTFKKALSIIFPFEVDDKEALDKFYELVFKKGYIPLETFVVVVDPLKDYNPPNPDIPKYKIIRTYCSYAGKKQARKLGVFKVPKTSAFIN